MPFLQNTIVSRPLCPALVHDDATRLVVCIVGLALCLYALYRAMRYFGSV